MAAPLRRFGFIAAAGLIGAAGFGLAAHQTAKAQGSVGTPSILEFRWDGNKRFQEAVLLCI